MGEIAGFGRRRRGPARLNGSWRSALSVASESGGFGSFLGLAVLAFVLSALGFAWLFGGDDRGTRVATAAASSAPAVTQSFGLCRNGGGDNCVIDGDTFIFAGTRYRIADIDTPETRGARCPAEKALGDRATLRLVVLLSAAPFELGGYERDEDTYGRKLRIIRRGGESVGMMLVGEGLARPWDGSRHPWC
jgi:micrococcal nuclease